MGVPTSEVGYTFAMPRREDHEVRKDMWGHGGGKKYIYIFLFPGARVYIYTRARESSSKTVSLVAKVGCVIDCNS